MINFLPKLTIIRKLSALIFGVLISATIVNAQVTVNPGAGSYATVNAAFTAINAGTHTGNITVEISGNTVETGPCVLNSSGAGAASYTSINIFPTSDNISVSGPTVTGRGLIELNGADNITIDGDNPNTAGINRNLTFSNTAANTVTYTSVIRIALSSLVNTADNNAIRNCNINGSAAGAVTSLNTSATTTGVGSSHGILVSGGASTVAVTTAPSAIASNTTNIASGQTAINFIAHNNNINACGKGIYFTGAALTVCPILTITNNTIGNPTALTSTNVAWKGISVQGFSTGSSITGNTIYMETFILTTPLTAAIEVGSVSSNSEGLLIERNTVARAFQNNTGGRGITGVNLAGGNNHIVRNNTFYNIKNIGSSSFSTTFGAFGVLLTSGTGHKVWHNSISISGSDAGTGNIMSCIAFTGTSTTGVDVRNNIFSNTVSSASTTSSMVCVYFTTSPTVAMALTFNNNAYYTGTNSVLNGIGQVTTTKNAANLYQAANFIPSTTGPSTNWRAITSVSFTANDAFSFATVSAAPFVSATDLHINTGVTATLLESGGASVGVVTDIDGQVRPGPAGSVNGGATAPDMGADEFDGVPSSGCSTTPTAGTATASQSTICNGLSTVLSLSGFTVDIGIEIQWQQSSTFGGTYTNIPGATNSSYTTPSLNANTFYKARVRCTNGNLDAFSNIVTITVNNPAVLTTTPGSVCGTGSATLGATADAGNTLNWYANSTGGVPIGTGTSFLTPVISSNTTFYVAASSGGSTFFAGRLAPVSGSGTNLTTYAQDFTLTQGIILNSVEVISTTGTSITVSLYDASGTTQLFTTGAQTVPTNTTNTITLGWNLAPGTYRLAANGMTGSFIRENSSVTYPFAIASVGQVNGFVSSISGSVSTSSSYYWFYNWSVTTGCEGSRTAVLASIVSPTAITTSLSSNLICNGTSVNLGVTSTNANYSYTWNPGNLTGANQTVTPTANTTYVVQAFDAATNCLAIDSVSVFVNPASASITTSTSQVCVSGSRVLTLSPAVIYGPAAIQWQSSPDGIIWTNIAGANGSAYTTPVLTVTTHYKALIRNAAGAVCLEPSIIITVNTPVVLTTVPGSRCGIGTVDLSATANPGASLNWYANASGGIPLGTGSTFTTPSITSSTNFYVSAVSGGGGQTNVGLANVSTNPSSGGGTTNFGIVFDAISAFTLQSVTIYPISSSGASGTVTIDIINSASTVLHTATFNVTGSPIGSPVPYVAVLNFPITPGTNMKIRPGFSGISGLAFEPSAGAPSGNYGYPFIIPGVVSLTSSTLTAAPTNTPRNDLYYYFYNWSVLSGCESGRTAVLAAVVASQPITAATNLSTICSGGTANLTVSSTNPNYTYTWTPGNQSGNSINVTPATNTLYTVNATDNVGCASQSTINVNVLPASASLATNGGDICVSGSRIISLTPSTGYPAGSLQWQNSPDGITYTDISGSTGVTYTTPTLTTTTFYRIQIKNSNGDVCLQPSLSLTVNTPVVSTATGNSRCGAGTVNLNATGSTGTTLKWYTAASGGASVATGTSYTTPVITATTNYYVSAATTGGVESAARPAPTTTANTTGAGWGLVFNVNSTPIVIHSVKIYSVAAAGSMTVQLTNSTGTVLTTAGPFAYGAGTVANPTVVTLPVNFSVPVGTGYRIVSGTMSGGSVIRETTGITGTWPYVSNSGNVSVTSGYISGTTLSTYYFFYDWQVSADCESGRTLVTATVIPSTPIAASSDLSTVCSGNSTSISVSSANANYDYTWSSTPSGFTASGAGPFTVTPTGTGTTYEVYGYDPSTQCGALSTVTVNTTTNNLFATISASPSTVCYGDTVQLNVAAGVSGNINSYSVAASSGTFVPITGTTTSLVATADDAISTAFNIGFTFNFGGITYTTVQAGSNGVLLFGTGRTSSATNNLATTTATQRPGLAPLWDDIQCTSGVTYTVTGAPGSRVFTAQWLNMEWRYLANVPVISFQVKLYEGSNVIQYIYRDELNVPNTPTASVGLMGVTPSDFLSLQDLTGSPAVSTTVSANSLTTKPANGQVYTFSPPTSGVLDYAWTGSNLSSSSISNPVAYNMVADETFSLTITDQSNGCQKTSTYDVVVNALPVPSAFSNSPVCENSDLQLFSFDGTNYNWSGPDNFSVTNTTGDAYLINAQQLNSGNYTITVTNALGCVGTETIYVAVNDNPEPFLDVMTEVSCDGFNDGTFQVGVNGGTPFFSFTENSLGQNFSGFYDNLVDGTYYIIVSDLNQCTSVTPLEVIVTTVPNLAPVITCPSNIVVTNDPGVCGALITYATPVGTDVCPVIGTIQTAGIESGFVFPIGITTNTYEVTDASNLTASCSFTVAVTDNENPAVTCAPDQDVNIDGGCELTVPDLIAQATATDNCSVMTFVQSPLAGTSLASSHNQVHTVTLTATDAAGNLTTCTTSLTAKDVTNPVITVCAPAQNVNVNTTCQITIPNLVAQSTATDNCTATLTQFPLAGTVIASSHNQTHTVVITATDAAGNAVTCSTVLTAKDVTAPTIACIANIAVNNTPNSCGAVVNYNAPVAADNCASAVTQTSGLASGSLFPIGTIVNTFIVTDLAGNTATCSFSVTVTDTQLPAIVNCPASFSSCNPITWTPPTITDNCPGLTVVASHTPGTNFPSGTTTVTYTATDAYNNVSVCSFNVTRLEESVAPTSITSNRDFNNICSGDNITLTINGGTLGQGSVWKWYTGTCGGTALPAFNGMSSITVSPTVSTTYFARAEGQCNTTACVSIAIVVSTAAPSGTTITSMPAFGAVGVTGVITVAPVSGATFYRWTSNLGHINSIWFNGSVGPVETAIPSVNVSFQIAQQNYQIRVVAGNACGRSNNASGHIRGTVPATTCLNGPVLACPNTTATYSVAACQIPGSNGYQWTIPSGAATITSGQGTQTITVAFAAGFTSAQICVNGVSNFGLAGPTTCLTVSNSTAAPGAISGNAAPCQSGLENYTISAVTGASSYLWTTNIAGATVSGTSTTGTVQFPSGPFSGNVCVQAVSSCGTSVATCFAVSSGSAGTPGPIGGPVSGICGASNVNYALATNNANSYNWILPTGVTLVSGGSSNSVNVNFATGLTGPIVLTVEAFYNCGSATSSITVDGAPATPTVTPNTICAGTDELYFASSAGADTYSWTTTGADYEECTNGDCSQYYVIWNVAGGSLSVTASNTCGTSAPFAFSTNCRIVSGGEQLETKVYPNPTNGNLTVEFTSYAGGNYDLTITDMSGRTILNDAIKASSGMNQHQVNLESANPGMYLVYLKDNTGVISVTKITKE